MEEKILNIKMSEEDFKEFQLAIAQLMFYEKQELIKMEDEIKKEKKQIQINKWNKLMEILRIGKMYNQEVSGISET